jgi:hypothetical protein
MSTQRKEEFVLPTSPVLLTESADDLARIRREMQNLIRIFKWLSASPVCQLTLTTNAFPVLSVCFVKGVATHE